MNEAVVNNMSIINGLNKVDGFDPSAFLRRLQDTRQGRMARSSFI